MKDHSNCSGKVLKNWQVDWLSPEHISFFYHEDGQLNVDEKLNAIYLPLNRVIFVLLTSEGKMSRLSKDTINANSYNVILGMSLSEYIFGLNPY